MLGPAIVEVFRRYAAGERLFSIARDWRHSTNRRTAYHALKRMLRNPAYVGRFRVGGQVYDGRHPALISEAVFAKVARRLEVESTTPPRRLAVANSLAGLAVCDECDGPLQMHTQRTTKILICRNAREFQRCGGPGSPWLDRIEAAVLVEIEAEAAGMLELGAQAERRAKRSRAKVDVSRIRRELSRTEAALGRAATLYAKRDYTEAEYRAAAEQLRGEIGALRAQLGDAEHVAAAPAPEARVKAARWIVKRWPRMTAEEKNRALKPLVREVRVWRAASYRQPEAERVHVEFW